MKALDVLMEEHRGIKAMLSVVEAAASRLEQGGDVPLEVFAGAVEFFKNFADTCHHAKEEDTLFPLLASHGLGPDTSVVNAMLAQHDTARAYVREMLAAIERMKLGDEQARPTLITNARAYAELLHEHIRIEDEYLYPLAAQTLSAAEDAELVRQFEEVERTRTGSGEHERYHRMIGEYKQVVASW